MDAAGRDRRHTRPLGGQRCRLAGPGRQGLAVLRDPLRPDVVRVADQVQDLHRWRADLVRFGDAGVRAGDDGPAHPIALADGDYLLPIYHETGHDREDVAADTTSLFLRRDKAKGTWTETNRVRSRLGNLQPAVVQIDDNYLVAYCRRGGGYGPQPDGFVVRTESRDGGRTWSPGTDTRFPNPNSAVDFIKLRNSHLLLVYNDNNQGERMPLTAAISTDGDRTYPYRRNLVDRQGTAAYPTAIQTRDGKIHVVFTSHDRTEIDHVVFEESRDPDARGRGWEAVRPRWKPSPHC